MFDISRISTMEKIIQNPGLQHIIEDALILLDEESIASFRLLNQDCKNIIDNPTFYLKKLSQLDEMPKDLITKWKKIIRKLPDKAQWARKFKKVQAKKKS